MYVLKTPDEIATMKKAGTILHTAIAEAVNFAKVGMKTLELDAYIEQIIRNNGGEPGFKRVEGYEWSSCICVNEQIVHTPPSDRVLLDGDVVTIDAGVWLDGLHTDSATTIQVGTPDKKTSAFLRTGAKALSKAIAAAQIGNRIGHISQAFQSTIEPAGYTIVKQLVGHGVGKELHEDPYIPCFVDGPIDRSPKLEVGMTLALEVMYTTGAGKLANEAGGWSLRTKDRAIAAAFEHTVAIQEKRTLILT